MTGNWKRIYNMMQQELLDITAKAFPAEREIEQCFVVCNRYLTDIRSVSSELQEQIDFNKDVLPFFIAEGEYYSFLSYARLFRPIDSVEGQRLFWQREEARLKKFNDVHKEFLDYYSDGRTDRDEEYFSEPANQYGTILSGHLALKKYNHYVQNELDVLSGFLK